MGMHLSAERAFAAPPNRCGDGVCRGKESFESCSEDCPVDGDPSNPPFVQTHEAALGHPLDALACEEITNVQSSVFDRGITLHSGEEVCGHLQCALYQGGDTVSCGHNSDFNDEPKPRVDINGVVYDPFDRRGLFSLWDHDPRRQGDPAVCFGIDGIIDPIVTVATAAQGEFVIRLQAFKAGVDGESTDLPGQCRGRGDTIDYSASIGPCTSDDDSPPGPGQVTSVTCYAGTDATVGPQGGGGIAKKCGCKASGWLDENIVIQVRGLPLE
jgi:hypothetical protein